MLLAQQQTKFNNKTANKMILTQQQNKSLITNQLDIISE